MGSHKGWDRHFMTIDGNVMRNGRSLSIAKGQFGVVDMEAAPTNRGQVVTDTFTGLVDRKFELRLGVAPLTPSRSQSDKAESTPAFKLSEITGLRVDAPTQRGIKPDHFIVGYDGIHPESAIVLNNGDNETIDVGIEGEAIGLLGYAGAKAVVKLYLEAPNTGSFTNQEIVENAVETFNRMTLVGGVPITTYVEATPTNSLSTTLTGTSYTYYNLVIPDNGDYSSLGRVQAQYPTLEVQRTEHIGGVSTYTILAPTPTVIADYVVEGGAILAECDECPAGYTLDGDLCISDTELTYEWAAGDVCFAQAQTYTITLGDDECGENRLAELQAAYPDLTIAIATAPTSNSSRTITITGTSGTANINIGGTNYLATYATSPTVTATNFMTTHQAAIQTATGGTLTRTGAVITLTDATTGFPAITATNATGDLSATLGTVTVVNANVTGGCMTSYQTTVLTNIVCEDCSPLYNGLFTSEAPAPFDMIDWVKAPKVYDPNALMGISFKTKPTIVSGDENFRDQLPFIASYVKLTVAGGYPGEIVENYNEGRNGRFAVKMVNRGSEPENLGGSFYDWEDRSNIHFLGRTRLEGNNYGKWALGQESHLKPNVNYVDYVLSVRMVRFAQSFSGEKVENFNFHILAEVGRHQDVEDVLNAMATEAGIPTVQAYS